MNQSVHENRKFSSIYFWFNIVETRGSYSVSEFLQLDRHFPVLLL